MPEPDRTPVPANDPAGTASSPAATPAGAARPADGGPLLEVRDLAVGFRTRAGTVEAVRGVSFDLAPGEVLAIVGESGSGKSVTTMSLLGLTRSPNARFGGTATLHRPSGDVELVGAAESRLRGVRGKDVAMIFQDPMTAMNPVQRVGHQIAEQIQAHEDVDKATARARAVELLRRVDIPDPETRARQYPHEFSGGMRQRAMIAMALSCDPSVLIADEPTTALDVTIQAQILRQIQDLRDRTGAAVIVVTHDLGVVADMADRIAVMYAGQIVEQGTVDEVFYDPQHPYTWGLLGSIARLDQPRAERLPTIAGLPPSLVDPPGGCPFAPRCPHVHDRCAELPPLIARGGAGHLDRCWLEPERGRELRVVDGRVGLAAPSGEVAA